MAWQGLALEGLLCGIPIYYERGLIVVQSHTVWYNKKSNLINFLRLLYRFQYRFHVLSYLTHCRVTNQIYVSVTPNTSSAKLGDQAVHNDNLAGIGAACFSSCSQTKLICHSVIKQCSPRKSTFYHESVPWQY